MFMASRRVKRESSYSLFKIESLHNLLTGISKVAKGCTVNHLSSDRLETGGTRNETRAFLQNPDADTSRLQSLSRRHQK